MNDTPISDSFDRAVRAERADTLNWMDQHAAAPAAVRDALGLAALWHGEPAMVRSVIPFSHFNMVGPDLDQEAGVEPLVRIAEVAGPAQVVDLLACRAQSGLRDDSAVQRLPLGIDCRKAVAAVDWSKTGRFKGKWHGYGNCLRGQDTFR